MKDWIKSLRLPACFFYSLIVIVSFKISDLAPENLWLYISSAFFISCASMVQNDWRDRHHDLKKGKCLVLENEWKYFGLVVLMWVVAFSMAIAMAILMPKAVSVIPWAMIFLGLVYSETRKIFLLPMTLIALTAASSALFPVFQNYHHPIIWMFSVAMFVASLTHEIIKDLEDWTVDIGYKNTLPRKIGTRSSEMVAGILMILAFGLMALITSVTLAGLPFCAIAYYCLFKKRTYLAAKRFFDGGIITATLVLLAI